MDKIFHLPRPIKRLISVSMDSLFVLCAFWLAMFFRAGYNVDDTYSYWILLSIVIITSILVNATFGLYHSVVRYLGAKTIAVVALSVFISTCVLVLCSIFFDLFVPRSIPVIYFTFLLVLMGGSRLVLYNWAHRVIKSSKLNVIIFGAGAAGIQLVNSLKKSVEYNPVAFIDDNIELQGLSINSIKVYHRKHIEKLIKKYNVQRILLALPSVGKSETAKLLNELESFKLQVLGIPGVADLVSGKSKIDDFTEVSIEDLLGRDSVKPNAELLHADIESKVVMVTGAGGSIGSELCRQIVNQRPQAMVLFELTEFALYSIHKELENVISSSGLNIELYPILGSVAKQVHVESVMESFQVETVYHAAAYKHVPLVEYNVIEGISNNIFGTLNCAQAAINANVKTFVLISTDKAVRPTNVMGASKRMAELCLQALADKTSHSTRFCMVRFGNVLGSSGSVVPLFKTQIAKGGPITLTHKDITRYFMTIPEAAQLVIQAGAMGMGGDVFVLDMGKPVKIYDLASKLIHLSGLHLIHPGNPNGDIAIKETGLRPGEKLYEELLIGDDVEKTGNERIMTASEVFLPWNELKLLLDDLMLSCNNFDLDSIRDILLNAPTQFNPSDGICDLVYLKKKSLPVI
jgi:FlaA1/EpsC-like NDP-sugar epimerase